MSISTSDKPLSLVGDFPAASPDQWRRLIDKALKGGDFERRLVARTADGIAIQPLFTARPDGVGSTGPVARGDGGAWDIRQVHAGTDPAAVNAAILEDLAGGASSVLLHIAAPGASGLPCGETEIARALEGVLLDVCPVALRAGEATPHAVSALTTLWNSRGMAGEQRRGAYNYDPLGTLAETGALAFALPEAFKMSAELVRQTLPWPHVTALCADGHVWHAAGASEAQELAAVLGAVVLYLRAAEVAGIAPELALPKVAVNLGIDADELMGLAKFRAMRRLLAVVAEACGAGGAAGRVTIVGETSRVMMTRRDPWVNMLRTTMATATAAMGGADCITVLPFTWALGQPDAFARRMARNTSIVLMEESGLGRVADPAGGSFAVETLTADLEQAAWGLFQEIEAAGGLAQVVTSGKLREEIAATADAKRAAIATGKLLLTGTNAFPRLGDDGVKVTPWPAPVLTAAAAAGSAGVRVTPLTPFRPSAPFEDLRAAADAYAARKGSPPRVFLACLGPLASHAARATWTSNFMAAGGIEAVPSPPLLQSKDVGKAFADGGADVVCLCGADETYAELAESTVSLLKTAGATEIQIAGRPKAQEAALSAAGVSRFIYAGCDMIQTLTAVQGALGVSRSGA